MKTSVMVLEIWLFGLGEVLEIFVRIACTNPVKRNRCPLLSFKPFHDSAFLTFSGLC